MGQIFATIDSKLQQWLDKQPMFFVATAPNDPTGHVNLSPKGGAGVFRIAWSDDGGLRRSGRERRGDCRPSARERPHRAHVLRLLRTTEDRPPARPGSARARRDCRVRRALARLLRSATSHVRWRAASSWSRSSASADSCGFGVPRMELVAERDQLLRWSEQQHAKNGDDWKQQLHGRQEHRQHRRASGVRRR